ncbi:MAG: aminomethyl-transferring glycine dehydrogenase subunit GcvPA [Nitrospirota bacterium]
MSPQRTDDSAAPDSPAPGYIPHTPADRRAMVSAIGAPDEEALLADIPAALQAGAAPSLPPACSELELQRLFDGWADQNRPAGSMISLLGAGAYDHAIPSVVGHVLNRSEFYTAYTPYQAEMSQGLLQAIYEYQTMICELMAMDVANASMYDGASALAEAALMAMRVTKRSTIVLAETLHPHYRRVVETYLQGLSCTLKTAPAAGGIVDPAALSGQLDASCAALIVQHPNFFGCLEEVEALAAAVHAAGGLLVVMADPVSLGLLAPPGQCGADIAVGEGQPLGIPMNFGGPYLGLLAARQAFMRQLPGRIVGATVDGAGRRGYCLTLQAREQHIRRERATSNICTNQALTALAATVHLAALGPGGLHEAAVQCWDKAHFLQRALTALPGVRAAHAAPFFKEFVITLPVESEPIARQLANDGVLLGLSLAPYGAGMEKALLCCVTEKRTRAELDRCVEALAGALASNRR